MTYADAEALLYALPRFAGVADAAYKPGFARIEALLAAMGDPHHAFPAVHVAGTNGKGSTASMAAALLDAHGYRVGLHTSPHLWHLSERLRVGGVPASEAWIARAVGRYAAAIRAVEPSFFEALVALSLCYFAEQEVEVAVVEVGLGGRLDATNVVVAAVSLVTSIALDHTDLLGSTVGAIAREKGGIFRQGVPALTNAEAREAQAALHEVAVEKDTTLETVLDTVTVDAEPEGLAFVTPLARYSGVRLDLGGVHQQHNAALALRGVEVFRGRALDSAQVQVALAEVRRRAGLRARLEWFEAPRILVDVAHNPAGIAAAVEEAQRRATGPLYVVLGMMQDKDVDTVARQLRAAGAIVFPVDAGGSRAFSADELGHRLRRAGVQVEPSASVPEALQRAQAIRAPGAVVLVTGSHGVVAQLPPSFFAETRRNR